MKFLQLYLKASPIKQKSPGLAEGQPEKPLVEGNLSFQLTWF
jgi:hypothetical protein